MRILPLPLLFTLAISTPMVAASEPASSATIQVSDVSLNCACLGGKDENDIEPTPSPDDSGDVVPIPPIAGNGTITDLAPYDMPVFDDDIVDFQIAADYPTAPTSLVPNMIGDNFGGTGGQATVLSFIRQDVHHWANGATYYNPSTGALTDPVLFVTPDPWSPILSTRSRAQIESDQNVDTVGHQIAMQENTGLNASYESVYLSPPEVSRFVSTLARLETNNGQGIYVNDMYSITSTWDVYQPVIVSIPPPSSGGVVGRTKIAENTSPLPQDRLIFNYSYFDNVPLYPGGVGVNRFTGGVEKTLFNGLMSFEVKVPMAITLDSTVVQDGGTDLSNTEFGNVLVTPKLLLTQNETFGVGLGMSLSVPTADDINVTLADGTQLVKMKNESVFLSPFLGMVWAPNSRFFMQGFLQYEFDANGSSVQINPDFTGLRDAGRIQGQSFQYLDVGVGYWVTPNIAFTAEGHWNKSLQAGDVVRSGNFVVGDMSTNVDLINTVIGAAINVTPDSTITVGYATPMTGDKQFDGELRVMVNRFFGGTSLARRAVSL